MFQRAKFSLIFWLVLILNFSAVAYASPLSTPPSPAPVTFFNKADNYLSTLVNSRQFSGSVLIARRGQILLSKGYGMADYTLATPNTPQTKFRIASLTKQFTAYVILKLQEQGKIRVQDRICLYLLNCPAAWQPITIYHLLTHTSGIPSLTEVPNFLEISRYPATPTSLLNTFKDKPLDFTPGQGYFYDNSGYIVLGYLIERITGESYEAFLHRNVFTPLGMSSTGIESSKRELANHASGYYVIGRVPSDYMDMSNLYAAANIYSTTEDLFHWEQALYTTKLLSQSSLDQMFTPRVPMWTNAPWLYGYGWIMTQQFNRQRQFHAGWVSGFTSFVDRYPDDQVTIIILSNWNNSRVRSISTDLAGMVFGE